MSTNMDTRNLILQHNTAGSAILNTDLSPLVTVWGTVTDRKELSEFIYDALTVKFETGKTPKELADENTRLNKTLDSSLGTSERLIEENGALAERVKELEAQAEDLGNRVNSARHYLMGVQQDSLTVEHALISLGYNESGF